MAKGWALRHPNGYLDPSTVSSTRDDCWATSYSGVASALGPVWISKYWKKWDESIRAAARKGYKIVRVEIREAKRG